MSGKEMDFLLESSVFQPAYLALHRDGGLWHRAREAVASLAVCRVCPRDCAVNRLENVAAVCKTGRYAIVADFFRHFGEEDCLRGGQGSGTIFFSMCNLRCVFCQNHDISHHPNGAETKPLLLANIMLGLQAQGAHNINFVTPEHVVPQILEALPHAVEGGLRIPLVYNTGAYDSMDSLRALDGVVDIYMPDLKFLDARRARKYLKAGDYPAAAMRALREMHRQVGDLRFDENGLARRGLLVRHLVMPGGLDDTENVLRFLAAEISPHTYVNIMDQYRPAGRVNGTKYAGINRRTTGEEHRRAMELGRRAGLYRFAGKGG